VKRTVKYSLIFVLASLALCAAYAQTTCHDEYICTPMGGCRWLPVCTSRAPLPAPAPPPAPMPLPPAPRPTQCHDEYICTAMGGCRWMTVCK
jgi:hypothetical protein